MENDELEMKVDILLAEYQAAHINRNHYDSVAFTVASILVATSFTLYGISFLGEVRNDFVEVGFLACVSFALMLIWYAYHVYVDPFVRLSIKRLWEIEENLRQLGFDAPKLHTMIVQETTKGRGRRIVRLILMLAYFAWLFRILVLVLTIML
ncbi:MAG: hypothetical protein OEX77_01580 [Candidatus Bathyarchaeota archaeon]|nr:hypothetical protein [Candidatus Bathyarchaeota archaeon]MDH5733124.1 hypothetical protein [Candidatus Bathyarchaeota archaeon]